MFTFHDAELRAYQEENMGVNIVDEDGKTKIRLDDSDQEKDVVVDEAGKEVSYNEAAAAKAKEVTDSTENDDKKEDE